MNLTKFSVLHNNGFILPCSPYLVLDLLLLLGYLMEIEHQLLLSTFQLNQTLVFALVNYHHSSPLVPLFSTVFLAIVLVSTIWCLLGFKCGDSTTPLCFIHAGYFGIFGNLLDLALWLWRTAFLVLLLVISFILQKLVLKLFNIFWNLMMYYCLFCYAILFLSRL